MSRDYGMPLRVMYLSPGPPSPPGSYVALSPGHRYVIEATQSPHLLELRNEHGTNLGWLQVVPEEAETELAPRRKRRWWGRLVSPKPSGGSRP